jgi:hypothetical protein
VLILSTTPPLTMDRHRSGVVEGIRTRLSLRPSPSAVPAAVSREADPASAHKTAHETGQARAMGVARQVIRHSGDQRPQREPQDQHRTDDTIDRAAVLVAVVLAEPRRDQVPGPYWRREGTTF